MEHQLGIAIAVTMFLKQEEYQSKISFCLTRSILSTQIVHSDAMDKLMIRIARAFGCFTERIERQSNLAQPQTSITSALSRKTTLKRYSLRR